MTAETETSPTAPASGCCGGGACGSGAADVQIGVTTVYQVTGMTCGHCEGAVSGEISGLPGVTSVKAVAATGQVTVVSEAPWTRPPCATPSTRPGTSSSASPDAQAARSVFRRAGPDQSHTGRGTARRRCLESPPWKRPCTRPRSNSPSAG